MKLIISNSSNVPIYEQIKQSIIEQILDETLYEDEMLPSIRSLAKELKISVMTIKKAYDDLEEEGYIITRQGKGSYVAPKNINLAKEQKQKEIESYLDKIVSISKTYHIEPIEIINLFKYMYGSDQEWTKLLK